MPASYPTGRVDRRKPLLAFQFFILFIVCAPASAGKYETNRAIEYYENGDYRRAKSILMKTDISNDPAATYMMGAITLKEGQTGTADNRLQQAIFWFELSANLNNPVAYQALGRTYEQRWLNERNPDDYESSKMNYELAINHEVELASQDLVRLVSSPKPDMSDADNKRLNEIDSKSYLAAKPEHEFQQDSRASNQEAFDQDALSQQSLDQAKSNSDADPDESESMDNTIAEPDNLSSAFHFGVGFGVPYGLIGANLNYRLSDAFDLTLGVGYGLGGGVRYHPLADKREFRLTLYYGDNTVIDDPITDKYETYSDVSIGIGYGSLDGGWDFDLVYIFIPEDAKDRIDELESMGYTVSGDTGNTIKFSVGYHW